MSNSIHKPAKQEDALRSSAAIILLLIYAVVGPLGFIPVALAIAVFVLARSTTVLDFAIQVHDDYHGSHYFERIKDELSISLRKETSSRAAIEASGLQAQLLTINGTVHEVQTKCESIERKHASAEREIKEQLETISKLRQELDTVKTQLADLKSGSEKKQAAAPPATSIFGGGIANKSTPSPAPAFSFGTTNPVASKKVTDSKPSVLHPSPSLGSKPAQPVPAPQPVATRIQLPAQLQSLNPTGSGFRCIGRAIASHGGACGSFSDEYLPQRGREQAAATLTTMRSPTAGDSLFELPALRDLANNMLCIRHRRGCRYDQSDSIAQKWHTDLSEQIKNRREAQKVTAAPAASGFISFGQGTVPTTSAASPFNSHPSSPASSVGSVSTAATTPETFDDRSRSAAAGKPAFDFGSSQSFSFGTPTPAQKDVFRF